MHGILVVSIGFFMTTWNVVFNQERLCYPDTIDMGSFPYQDAVRFLEQHGFNVTVSDDADYEYFVEAMAKMNAIVNHLDVENIRLVVPGSDFHSDFNPELPTIGAIPNQYRFIPTNDGIWSYSDMQGLMLSWKLFLLMLAGMFITRLILMISVVLKLLV